MSIGKELIQLGLLTQTVGKFPVVELNARSWEVLHGKESVTLTKFEEPKAGKKTGKPKATAAFEAGSEHQTRFHQLRQVRYELAKSSNVPSYLILSDRSLKALCVEHPTTLSDLASIHGFGKVKIAKFGQRFLDALNEESA